MSYRPVVTRYWTCNVGVRCDLCGKGSDEYTVFDRGMNYDREIVCIQCVQVLPNATIYVELIHTNGSGRSEILDTESVNSYLYPNSIHTLVREFISVKL